MSVNALADDLNQKLTHELATDAWAAQLKDSNYEDEQVREELEPILHDTDNFNAHFDDVGKLADKITDEEPWKILIEAKVDRDRVNALFWLFIDKALAKNSNTRDVEYGFAASCCWMKLAGLKGGSLYNFFNQYLYKKTLDVFRLIYRLKMYGSRTVTTIKKKAAKGKKGAKNRAPMNEQPEDDEDNALEFNNNELADMLEKACEACFSLITNTALSKCPEQANHCVDLVRDLMRLDLSKDTLTTPIESLRDMRSCDQIADRAFGLAHLLCESKHSNGGVIVHTRLIMPRLLFFSWEGEVVPTGQTIPAALTVARDMAISFLKNRIENLTDQEELETIAKLVSNIMARCPDRAEYRQKVAQSALALLALLPKKVKLAQLQLVYTFGLTTKTGLRALAVEMIPSVMKMDLNPDEEEEEEEGKSRREKGSDEEEEEEEDGDGKRKKKEKKKRRDEEEEEEEEDDEMNGTKRKGKKEKKKKGEDSEEDDDEDEGMNRTRRKIKKEKKGKKRGGSDEEEEEEEMERTRRKKRKGSDEEEEEEDEDANTTKKKTRKEKKNKRREEDEEEEEEEGNTTKRRGRAVKDQSMMRKKKQKKRNEEDSEEDEESEDDKENKEKEKKEKKKQAEQAKLKNAQRSAPVPLRPSLLMLIVRGCLDKAGNLRARSLQQLSQMVLDGQGDLLKEAADNMVRDYPRIVVQAMTSVDEEKDEMEEEDEERKARAAKLAELAAAELKINNGLMYVVKSRMEDDVAAVRKAAIAAVQTLFFVWQMEAEEAEETANALKLRCLDNSQMVRRQAMETLSFLLDESINKGHRPLLETTWLRAVLPLINDREDGVQSMAARMVEEVLITPIMRTQTPASCWHMLKRVEEEVSNRRLLVRTLAYLSTKETKTMKETVVDTLNKKLTTDPDHSNVIWMLLADLSTVFGDKIDPRTAVRTWYDLPEHETSNTMSYVAKVVGEGAKKLRGDELDKVSKDMEDKLFAYRVHGPHIATVYLALARLMDAVGELAVGKDELERFGRSLLDEGSRIIYGELEMFTEMEEDRQEVAKEEEIRVIRIVITIGEVIQLSPNLIDSAQKLFDGLKLIMSSELYLSEAFQQQRRANSAMAGSRVVSAMGNYGDAHGHGQSMHSENGNRSDTVIHHPETVNRTSQQTVIPSQVDKEAKSISLRKALFTPPVRRCALTTIGKFCLMDEKIAQKCIHVFSRQLKLNPDHIIRNNIVVVLCDLCIRFTSLVDKHTPIIASCLKDRSILVRQQTLECLTILIKEAFIRWEGQLMYRFVATILDECRPIRDYAIFCLTDVLLPQDPSMFFNHFIECLLYFNDVPRKYKMANAKDDIGQGMVKFTLSGNENEPARIKLYEFMLATFDDKQKFITMAKMCEEIFSAVYTNEMNIEDERVVALLTDAFKVISCEQMQLKLDVGKKGEDEEEDAPVAVQEAAKTMITSVFRTAIITSIMPHVLELRRYLIDRRHPTMKYMLGVLRALTRSHMDQLKEFFAGDKIALREIEYDIRRLNNLEDKMKLRAAQAAQMEAERARLPPSRRQSMMREGMNEKDQTERELPDNTNQMEMMEGMEGIEKIEREEPFHPEARVEASIANENENEENVDVEMDEAAAIPAEEDNVEVGMEKEAEEKDGEEEAIEVEETEGGERREKEKEQADTIAVEEEKEVDENEEGEKEDEGEENEKENKNEEKKSRAERGEAEIKDEPMEEEGEGESGVREEKRNRRKEEKGQQKRKEIEVREMEIKEEPVDEGEERENQFVAPLMTGPNKRSRAASEMSWMNESAMVGGYGQSTPRKGTPNGEEGGIESGPRLDLDISAIAPPPAVTLRTKSRISRKPKTGTIEE